VSFSNRGAFISRDDRYCEVTASSLVFPPDALPFMIRGALPLSLVETARDPRSFKERKSGFMGRLLICSSPVKREYPSPRAAVETPSLRVVPELPTSITSSGVDGFPPNPVISSPPSSFFISAPKAPQTRMAASVSRDKSGDRMTEVPSARLAIYTERIV